jgi:hypothetical protein
MQEDETGHGHVRLEGQTRSPGDLVGANIRDDRVAVYMRSSFNRLWLGMDVLWRLPMEDQVLLYMCASVRFLLPSLSLCSTPPEVVLLVVQQRLHSGVLVK